MGHKNDYSCIFFLNDGKVFKMKYVHNLYNCSKWVENHNLQGYKYFNVYDRRKGNFLRRFYRGNYIPAFI